MSRQAAADTRGHKSGHGAGDLRSRWLAEAGTVGVTVRRSPTASMQLRRHQPEVEQSVTVGEVIGRGG